MPERPPLERLRKQAKARKRERATGLSAAQARAPCWVRAPRCEAQGRTETSYSDCSQACNPLP